MSVKNFNNDKNGSHSADGWSTGNIQSATCPRGVVMSPYYVYRVKPIASQTNNVAAAQTAAAAGYLTLVAPTGIAGTGTTKTTFNGRGGIQFDCPRTFVITGVNTVTARDYTFFGMIGNQPVVETITGPANANSVTTKKAMDVLTDVYVSGGTTANITIGTSNVFGLPLLCTQNTFLRAVWNNIEIPSSITNTTSYIAAKGTATLVAGTIAVTGVTAMQANSTVILSRTVTGGTLGQLTYGTKVAGTGFTINSSNNADTSTVEWTVLNPGSVLGTVTFADLTSPATAATGDTKGTVTIPDTAGAPNGNIELVVHLFAGGVDPKLDIQVEFNTTLNTVNYTGLLGVKNYTRALI